jgi:UDP-2,4-diacetamido-2,4,6-trideoxy-beta-L-altropyranose hydrolase
MSPRIVFAPDSGDRIGGGHVMRCLTLAGAMQASGADCAFLVGEAGRRLLETFGMPGLEVVALGEDDAPAAIADKLQGLLPGADIVVIDNYRVDAAQEQRLAQDGARIVAVDDLADRPHRCDVLVDPGFERRAADYLGLVPEGAQLLIGTDYALVRPAFAALRDEARTRRDGRAVGRVLVSLGLTDVGAITGAVAAAVLPMLGEIELDVVVGAGAPSMDALSRLARNDARIRLHVDAAGMERLMLEADMAIGAGGSSTWERACLGLPSISLVLADNQRRQAQQLQARGLTLAVEAGSSSFIGDLSAAWSRLAADGALRRDMAELNLAHCDGCGASRVARAILAGSHRL